MADSDQLLYVSLEKNDKGDVIGHRVSFQQPSLDIPSTANATTETEKVPSADLNLTFESVFGTFCGRMESYRKFIRFTLDLAPPISHGIAEQRIGAFLKSKGKELPALSSKNRTVYELQLQHLREFRIIDDDIRQALDGARHLPEVMEGNVDRVTELMKRLGTTGGVTGEDYRTWPVFRDGVRTDKKFITTFESVFGKPLIVPTASDIDIASTQGQVH